MSRLENTGRNAIWATSANILYTLGGIVDRYVFLMVLNETYLGVSSLFSSLIGILSFADLGLNNAFTFCFYKPIEERNIQHIQSILNVFKKTIRYIAIIIAVAGLSVIPFLRIFVHNGEAFSDRQLVVYYLIALSKTVLSYWMMYKTCYVTACQKAYKLVPFNLTAKLVTILVQIIVLLVCKSFVIWSLCGVVVTIIHYLIMDRYIKNNFPETVFDKADPIPIQDKKSIISNVKATIFVKFGEICVRQTDSIIVSSMIGIATNGLLSNYELIKHSVLNVVTVIQNAVVPSLGSLIASEDEQVQKNVLYTYMMINYGMIGFAMCGIGILSSPFIMLFFGVEKTVDETTVTLMCIGFYFAYQTYALNAFPTAAGKMILGAWASAMEGISNLAISVVAVKTMGLPGVYVGTVASQVVNYVIRAFTTFLGIYKEPPYKYLVNTMLYFCSTLIAYGILWTLRSVLMSSGVTVYNFLQLMLMTPVVFFGVAWIIWGRSKYGKEALNLLNRAFYTFCKKKAWGSK